MLITTKIPDVSTSLIKVPEELYNKGGMLLLAYIYLYSKASAGSPATISLTKMYAATSGAETTSPRTRTMLPMIKAVLELQQRGYIKTDINEKLKATDTFEMEFTDYLDKCIGAGETRYFTLSYEAHLLIQNRYITRRTSLATIYKVYMQVRALMMMQNGAKIRAGAKILQGDFFISSLAKTAGINRSTMADALNDLEEMAVLQRHNKFSHHEYLREKTTFVDLTYINWRAAQESELPDESVSQTEENSPAENAEELYMAPPVLPDEAEYNIPYYDERTPDNYDQI